MTVACFSTAILVLPQTSPSLGRRHTIPARRWEAAHFPVLPGINSDGEERSAFGSVNGQEDHSDNQALLPLAGGAPFQILSSFPPRLDRRVDHAADDLPTQRPSIRQP